jgi:hypothetical protein
LIGTLSRLGFFATIVAIMVGLIYNMFYTSTFLGQSCAQCLELEQIIQGYFNGIIVGLMGCVVTLVINSTILVGIIGITGSSFFLL